MRTLNHPRLSVTRRNGREGPSHDPYAFEEIRIDNGTHAMTIHVGLAIWIEIDDDEREFVPSAYYDEPDAWLEEHAQMCFGWSLKQIARFEQRALDSRWRGCEKGGRHVTTTKDGFPGETFDVCERCNKIVDSQFFESAVI